MANATSGDAALGNLVQSKTKDLIAAAYAAKDALDTTTGTTQAMDPASAVEFPEDMVSLMAKNKDAAKKLKGFLVWELSFLIVQSLRIIRLNRLMIAN